jgi:hypothetical protein
LSRGSGLRGHGGEPAATRDALLVSLMAMTGCRRSNESRRSGRTGARATYSEQIAEYEERGERIDPVREIEAARELVWG